jgi:hypothetical protein
MGHLNSKFGRRWGLQCSLSLWRSKHFHYICQFFFAGIHYPVGESSTDDSSLLLPSFAARVHWRECTHDGLPFLPSLLVNQLFCGWSIWTLERFLAVFSWALQGRKNYFYFSLFVFLLDGVEHLGLRYFLLSLVIILGRNNWVSFFLFIVYCWLKHETTKNVASLEIWIAKFVVYSQLVFIMTFMFGLFWGVNDK